jgi:hypothetical protein
MVYVWNMFWYTGNEMELKSRIHGTDISCYSKPFKTVFALADQLLNQGYIISLDNYYSSPELSICWINIIPMQYKISDVTEKDCQKM